MLASQFILMGDVVDSRDLESVPLQRNFEHLVDACNRELAELILSPLTITLGDEFQGLTFDLTSAVDCLFFLEERRLAETLDFVLHFVVHEGEIETPVNREIAYGMMGPGLTRARELLTESARPRPRFLFELQDGALSEALNHQFRVYEGLLERWSVDDYPLILRMLAEPNNTSVAAEFDKNRSQIWKRRKTLLVEEYRSTKEVIRYLVSQERSV